MFFRAVALASVPASSFGGSLLASTGFALPGRLEVGKQDPSISKLTTPRYASGRLGESPMTWQAQRFRFRASCPHETSRECSTASSDVAFIAFFRPCQDRTSQLQQQSAMNLAAS